MKNDDEIFPDVEGSKKLLKLFCDRAKNLTFPTSPFPQPVLTLIVTAFERYLSGEEKDLEKCLGLKPRPGRRWSKDKQNANLQIAVDVARLNQKGWPLKDTRESEGAFSKLADHLGLKESGVRDIYYKYQVEALSLLLEEEWEPIENWIDKKEGDSV